MVDLILIKMDTILDYKIVFDRIGLILIKFIPPVSPIHNLLATNARSVV